MSKRRRWNSSETGTLAILGFQRARKDLEALGDPSTRSVPVVLGGPEDLEALADLEAPAYLETPAHLETPEDLETLVDLEVPADLGVRAGLEFQFGMLGPSPTGRCPYWGLRIRHEL
jgi:hypothetical protein